MIGYLQKQQIKFISIKTVNINILRYNNLFVEIGVILMIELEENFKIIQGLQLKLKDLGESL